MPVAWLRKSKSARACEINSWDIDNSWLSDQSAAEVSLTYTRAFNKVITLNISNISIARVTVSSLILSHLRSLRLIHLYVCNTITQPKYFRRLWLRISRSVKDPPFFATSSFVATPLYAAFVNHRAAWVSIMIALCVSVYIYVCIRRLGV